MNKLLLVENVIAVQKQFRNNFVSQGNIKGQTEETTRYAAFNVGVYIAVPVPTVFSSAPTIVVSVKLLWPRSH